MADDEDDYMTMTFGEEEDTSKRKRNKAETSLQRRIRLEREGRERGHVPSKAALAKAAETEREAALNRSLFDAPSKSKSATASKWPDAPPPAVAQPPKPVNKGLAMMAKMGFVAGQALGKKREVSAEGEGEKDSDNVDHPVIEPIRIEVKRDRAGIGAAEEKKKKGKAEEGEAKPEAKRLRLDDMDPMEYRDRLRQEREAGRLERQIHAAQIVAERMARGDDDNDAENREEMPIKDVNILWRGMVKERRAKEHERAQRIKAQRLLDDRLRNKGTTTNYAATEQSDEDEDGDDRITHGKGPSKTSFLDGGLKESISAGDGEEDDEEDNEDKDEELDEFNLLEPKERLQQVVDWMRQNRRYCFWCKYTYPDNDLEGCPGPTEEDHD
ncbi:hypothetical protein SEUCBS139899_002282 [Sporothrix eucalyptigena]